MTPQQVKNMRSQLADYAKGELVDLAISLQDVVDDHLAEKRGLQSSIDAMGHQIPALQAELAKYEDADPVDSEETEALRQKVAQLSLRVNDLSMMNEGLQKKLIG
jgi:hypothetical protein